MTEGETAHSEETGPWDTARREVRAAMDRFALENPQGVGPEVAAAMIRWGQTARAVAENNGWCVDESLRS